MGPEQTLHLQVRVDQGVMAINRYFTFPKAPGVEPHRQIQLSVISKALVVVGDLTLLQRSIPLILQTPAYSVK